MIRAVLVDDEPKAIDSLSILLSRHCKQVVIVDSASNAADALKLIESTSPHVVFLDINMPNETGLELIKKLDSSIKVVFTTAYDEYALQAFRLAAFDYLLKPIDKEELIEVVDRIERQYKSENGHIKMELLQQLISKPESSKKIAINTSDSLHVVDLDEVLYLSSEKNYTHFQLADRKFLATKPISFFEDLLKDRHFLRVHRSFMVNLTRAKEFKKKMMIVLLDDGSCIEVARNRKDELLERLQAL